jgi:hypothetical protein
MRLKRLFKTPSILSPRTFSLNHSLELFLNPNQELLPNRSQGRFLGKSRGQLQKLQEQFRMPSRRQLAWLPGPSRMQLALFPERLQVLLLNHNHRNLPNHALRLFLKL